MAIMTIAEMQKILGRPSMASADADVLENIIMPIAQSHVQDYVGFVVEQATFTEFHPQTPSAGGDNDSVDVQGNLVVFGGGDGAILQLGHLPVRSITSIYEDAAGYFGDGANAFAAATLLTAGTDYYLVREESGLSMSGHVRRLSGGWCGVPGSIKATYVAGYTAAELGGTRYGAFQGAFLDTVVDYWDRYLQMLAGMGGREMTAAGIGGGVNASYVEQRMRLCEIPDSAAAKLEGFIDYSDLEI